MTDYHFIVLVCLLGMVGESLRIRRPGQVFVGPNLLGRYRLIGDLLEADGGSTAICFLPLFPAQPTLRLRSSWDSSGRSVSECLDLEQSRRSIDEIRGAVSHVLPLSRVLFVYLVGLVPVALLTSLVPNRWPVLGITLALIQVALLLEFGLAHRRLFPDRLGERIKDISMILLFPPAGVFAAERLSAVVLDELSPLPAAMVLCPESEAKRVAHLYACKWRYPLLAKDAEISAAYLQGAEILWKNRGWSLEELLAPPVADSFESQSYCPRCHAQFLVSGGDCPDCPGVGRKGLSKAASD
jgi:hypothetical protein